PGLRSVSKIVHADCSSGGGSCQIHATGGLAGYLYDIGNGPTLNNQFTDLAPGNYFVNVTDAAGCSDQITVTILGSSPPTFDIINVVPENCGQTDGSFEILATNAVPPFTYNIGAGATANPVFSNLNSGVYNVVVTDNFGCSAAQIFTLDENEVSINVDNVVDAACGQNNGSILVSATGGIAPIIFDWGNGPSTTGLFENLSPGNYNITLTDANGCSDDVSVTILGSDNPSFSIINIMNENCGQTDGGFEIAATGGTPPYTYNDGSGPTVNPVYANINAAAYNIVVTDANGCSAAQIFTLEETLAVLSIDAIEHTSCGEDNGSILVAALDGTPPFTYDIGNGATSNNIFGNLAAGIYNITFTDANGCTDVQVATVNPSTNPTITISDIINEDCGLSNGGFTVNGAGGTLPYTFDIGNGATPNNIFSNLVTDTYEVTLTDANSCTATETVVIIGENAPTVALGDIIPATCGLANGAISVFGLGGTPPYTFDFGSGASASNVGTNLAAGIYTITITDINNCSGTTTAELPNTGDVPVANFSYVDTLLTFNFTDASTGGDSYLWDFGDGNTSSEMNPIHTFSSNGNYEVCLTVTNNCGNDQWCQTVTAFQPVDVIFDLAELSGEAGDTVFVGVEVDEFKDIISFQKSIHLDDTTVARFVGVENLNLTNLEPTDFNISHNTITVNWQSAGNQGITLSPNTVIYELAVELQFNLDCSAVVVDNDPLPVAVVQNVNGNTINIGAQVMAGEVCVTNILSNTVEIAGLIAQENGMTVANVDVNCTNAPIPNFLTNTSGAYEYLDLPQGGNYTVTPFKNDNAANGLTALDLAIIQQHIVGISLLDSPYKMIAADANNSGTITALDLVAVQSVILGNATTFPNNTSWRFVPEAFVFPNPTNPFAAPFPEEIILNNLLVDALTEHFVAIKIGDVNLTSAPNLVSPPAEKNIFAAGKNRAAKSETFEMRVKQNAPNPFNQRTVVRFYLSQEEEVIFSILDQQGKIIDHSKKILGAGEHQWEINAATFKLPGLYFYQLQTRQKTYTRRMIFVK
ncbi:MAG: PKD domain-containing protein, partial [Bacteroidota bacterium]